MILGIDFDGTFGADVATFRKVTQCFLDAGHACVVITNRYPDQCAQVDAAVGGLVPVLYCAGRPKRLVASEAGYVVDVWIDDNPILVDYGTAGLRMVGEHWAP